MRWLKKGLLLSKDTVNLSWYKKFTLVPVPHLLDSDRLRIYVTMCDSDNIGRIGYLDVNPKNPSDILDVSQKPILDIGEDGRFDDNGVVTSSILQDGRDLYLYYSGYQIFNKIPYTIFSGVAKSTDNGRSFFKVTTDVPMLDRVDGEISTRCAPFVMKEGQKYRMWYTSDCQGGWSVSDGKKVPIYDLKHLTSKSPVIWPRNKGITSVGFEREDEHGIAKSTIWKEDGIYKIIYSVRNFSNGYRLGYAESQDGVVFHRMDEKVGITVSDTGWDSEMIAFAERIRVGNKVYLFYCGNQYGLGGMGYAELSKDEAL